MNRSAVVRFLAALAAALLVAAPAGAHDTGTPAAAPRTPQLLDDATLAGVSGKYYGGNMLVGLRVDLVSTLQTPAGTATASGALSVERVGAGFVVRVGTHSEAQAAGDGATVGPAGGTAGGGETIHVDGIGQVTQIAGDGNRMVNLTTIAFAPAGASPALNGQTSSEASAGAMSARIGFAGGGLTLGLGGPGATLAQTFATGPGGGIAQLGQLAGDGLAGSNQLQLQLTLQAMPVGLLHQLGVQQALSGLVQLGR